MKVFLIAFALTFGSAASAADVPSANEQIVKVKGMVCAFCAQGIEKRFKAQNEIESIQVSLEKKIVKLRFKEGMKLPFDKIERILKESGYDIDKENQ